MPKKKEFDEMVFCNCTVSTGLPKQPSLPVYNSQGW